MYDIGLQLLGVRDCDVPGELWTLTRMCSITQTGATSHNRAVILIFKQLLAYRAYVKFRHETSLTVPVTGSKEVRFVGALSRYRGA